MARSTEANGQARLALVLGILSIALLPGGVAVSRWTAATLVQSGAGAVPLALAAGIWAVVAARRARRRSERTLGRVGGLGLAAWGKWLGVVGICLATAGAISLVLYGVLAILER